MYQFDFDHPVKVFFCGIGGISMSGLALILKSRGYDVCGSDRAESDLTRSLAAQGIPVAVGQRAENITQDIAVVVFTAAIHPDNPEYLRTKELGIPSMTRAELLGEILRGYDASIAVAGTHGKTTTTSMISEILMHAGYDPTISVGGILDSIGGNVRIGSSGYMVAEACEYTNSFLSMTPWIGIILNIDADHLDFFKDLADIRHSFRLFAERIPSGGALIINSDIPDLDEFTKGLSCRIVTFGSDAERSDYYPTGIRYDENARPSYNCCHSACGIRTQRIRLGVPGEHNVMNSLAAVAAADLLGVSREDAAAALAGFGGTERRFEYKGTWRGVRVIDDYAHHPTEIRATLRAAQGLEHDRIFCIFQPHTYTRTKALLDEFADALALADVVILADIYAARETDTLGVSSELLAQKIRDLGHEETYWFPSFEKILEFVRQNCRTNDVLITMGAGNVTEIGPSLLSGGN